MMDKEMEQEKKLLKFDIENSINELAAEQIIFANRMNSGLGEQIKEYLKNPPQPDKKFAKEYKKQQKKNKIRERLRKIFLKKD